MVTRRSSAAGVTPKTGEATIAVLSGLAITWIILPSDHPVDVFTTAAIGVGLSLILATGIEATAGIRSLIRVDILMLWALYGLTLLEFLFPQPDVDTSVSPSGATSGTYAVLLGFAGLAVGRHVAAKRRQDRGAFIHIQPKDIFFLFSLAALLGYMHIFLAVNFDLLEVLRQMALPRFQQSWGRGQYGGDIHSLLVEIGALIYLIPPIAGLIFARSNEYSFIQKCIVTWILSFTFYYGFSSGTRNIMATYAITFLGAYFMNRSTLTLWQVVYKGVPVLSILAIGMVYMLQFRTEGLGNFSFSDDGPTTLYIDHNLIVVSQITEVFPRSYEFLGLEIPVNTLIHPIPRMFWPGKPEGLSVGVEEAVGAPSGVTVACTFVGEAYMSGGLLAVLFASLLFGAMAEIWNSVGRNTNSPFSQLLYASGFFSGMLTMRSMQWLTVAMLPTIALWLYGRLWIRRSGGSGASVQA
jgi:oligosaccharide repeat unit polymerase